MVRTFLAIMGDVLRLVALGARSHNRLAAENLFLRKQLAFYVERHVTPRRLDDATRITLTVLARFIEWRRLLTVVQPDTLLRWHRQGFRLFWRWPARTAAHPGSPRAVDCRYGEWESHMG
jgi:putative transposase